MSSIYKYHWFRNFLCDERGAEQTAVGLLPKLYSDTIEKVFAFQFVQDAGNNTVEPYLGIDAATTCNFRADNDYANGPTSAGSAEWLAGSGAEFYKITSPIKPTAIYIDDSLSTEGAVGSLSEGGWAFDGKRLYVRLVGDADPTAQPDNFVGILYGTASYTPPFAQCESDKFNLAGTWPVTDPETNVITYRDPEIADGECTFTLTSDTFNFISRLAQIPFIQISGQIGLFDGDESDYKLITNSFGVYNIINPVGPPVPTPSPWLTKAMGLSAVTEEWYSFGTSTPLNSSMGFSSDAGLISTDRIPILRS